MVCILQDYRDKQRAIVWGEIESKQFHREIEKMKEKYGVKGFSYDGIRVRKPIKVSKVLERVKRDVLKICPDAEFKVGNICDAVVTDSSGKEILRDSMLHPDYVVIKAGKFRIFMDNTGFGEETNNYDEPLDETASRILGLLEAKYYKLKRLGS
jgi:hypothetical protein